MRPGRLRPPMNARKSMPRCLPGRQPGIGSALSGESRSGSDPAQRRNADAVLIEIGTARSFHAQRVPHPLFSINRSASAAGIRSLTAHFIASS